MKYHEVWHLFFILGRLQQSFLLSENYGTLRYTCIHRSFCDIYIPKRYSTRENWSHIYIDLTYQNDSLSENTGHIYMLDSDQGPVPHRGPISTTGANLIPHRGPILIVPQLGPISHPIRGNVKILRDDVVRFIALPMMTLKINVIIKMATSTEIDVLY